MKRRPFLTKISALGISGLISFDLKANTRQNPTNNNDENNLVNGVFSATILQKLENEYISFTWMSDASALIVDKIHNATWQMGSVAIQEEEEIEHDHVWVRQDRSICEQYPARFRGKLDGGAVKFTMIDSELVVIGSFKCTVNLINEYLTFSIFEIDEKIPNLSFPTPIENEMLLLPEGIGKLLKEPSDKRMFHSQVAHLNMRFFGGLKMDNNGYIAIFDQNYEDSGLLTHGLNASPLWQKSLGKYADSRSIKYSFINNGYVGIAKKYRIWATENGLVKTLAQKIKESPQLQSLIGGRQITFYQCIAKPKYSTLENQLKSVAQLEKAKPDGEDPAPNVVYTFAQLKEIVAEIKTNWGFKNGIINIRGWIKGGYDYSHPDVWPPEPFLGTVDELKELCATKDKYFTLLHDNYQDIYSQSKSFPKGINITNKGKYMRGGIWASGQAYILNSRDSLKYAERNWDQIKQLKTGGMFVDTTTAVQLYQSYEKSNTATRSDDLNNKLELIKFYKNQNQVFGSEEVADFGAKDVDFFETRHARIPGVSVPLWPLVFHDCAMTSRYVDTSNMKINEKSWLEDMLWGYFILARIGTWGKKDWTDYKADFMATLHVDDWFGQIATAQMTNHEFLSEDFQLEKTTFSNGKSIVVNFSKEIKYIDGVKYPALSYKIKS